MAANRLSSASRRTSSSRVSTAPSSSADTASPSASISSGLAPKARFHAGLTQMRAAAIRDR